ncbi:hypothetical protein ACIOEX_18950 [Streptomyces sp. NPDC087850]|uniref:hypothetical protein n=1 Tax=Streptomyces sp. NPDC087850 TaxID=3365809 RepID=UPI0037F1668A
MCFSISDVEATLTDFESLVYAYGWPPSENKRLTVRERIYWRDLALWNKERKEVAAANAVQ